MSIKRIAGSIMVAGLLTFGAMPLVATSATASPAHSEQGDGSDHGNSNKPARQDPQPDKGKDCMEHGRWGGVNEDHCDGGLK